MFNTYTSSLLMHYIKRFAIVYLIILCNGFLNNSASQWIVTNGEMQPTSIFSFTSKGLTIYCGNQNQNLYYTANSGVNWIPGFFNGGIPFSLASNINYVFAGTDSNGVYISSNNGVNWSQTTLVDKTVYSLVVSGDTVFAGTADTGVYLSTDNGSSWTQTSLNDQSIKTLAKNGNNVFAGTSANGSGIYLSTDYGTTWSLVFSKNEEFKDIAIKGNYVFAGTSASGLYISSNSGQNWSPDAILTGHGIWSIVVNGNYIYAGDGAGNLYISGNNGVDWANRNEGLPTLIIGDLIIANTYIFAGTAGDGVFKRPVSELIGVAPISTELPINFSLSQNYPNPFNPVTKIRFALPKYSLVKIVVYDNLGREIETLVNETLKAGIYETDWFAVNFSSGIYYYKLDTDGFTETKKMILLK